MRFQRSIRCGIRLLLVLMISFISLSAYAIQVNDRVQLVMRQLGIPAHPGPGDRSISHRFTSGQTATVTAFDPTTEWFEVEDTAGNTGWIVRRYIDRVLPVNPVVTNPTTGQCHRIGTWNLEHFHENTSRGFPENRHGGPTYPERATNDITAIAAVIRDTLNLRILILNEIMGEQREINGEIQYRSDELDLLVDALGNNFAYIIAESGGSQRVALLYDTHHVQLNAMTEIFVDRTVVQDSDLFARDPLLAHFSFLQNGGAQNDLLVVGLHLASGQHKTRNHDQAMALLQQRLDQLRGQNVVYPAGEHDIFIGGDLNASNYDTRQEQFFVDYNQGRWALLAGANYPATRLGDVQAGAGYQLGPKSIIDYLIVSRHTATASGLLGEEITQTTADVHQGLTNNQWEQFRRIYSDHFPVTTCIAIQADND